ncbi:unnamed protein product, partial [Prorocentrum cordatum]
MGCNAERQAQCVGGYCICRSGGCVGAEGNCHKETASYELVASNIRLRNVKYDEYLYVPKSFFTRQLRVGPHPGKLPDRWNVYRVPGVAFGQAYHVLSPVDYPGYVASYAAGITGDQVIVWDIRGSGTRAEVVRRPHVVDGLERQVGVADRGRGWRRRAVDAGAARQPVSAELRLSPRLAPVSRRAARPPHRHHRQARLKTEGGEGAPVSWMVRAVARQDSLELPRGQGGSERDAPLASKVGALAVLQECHG